MTPEEVGERLVALLVDDAAESAVTAGVSGGGPGHERAVVDVPVARWWEAIGTAKHNGVLGCDFFDWLSAVDELDDGFAVVAHLYSSRRKHGLLLRTRVPREDPVVESMVELFPGAAWHERETFEMFGITFAAIPTSSRCCCRPSSRGTRCARSSSWPAGWPRRGRAPRSRGSRSPARPSARRCARPVSRIRTSGVPTRSGGTNRCRSGSS